MFGSQMMALVVGWTLVGAFVFTMVITCLSLVGWVKFADKSQQRKLFYALVVELVVGFGGQMSDLVTFDPRTAEESIAEAAGNRVIFDVAKSLPRDRPIEAAVIRSLADRIGVKHDPEAAKLREELLRAIPERGEISRPQLEKANRLLRDFRVR